MNQIVYAGKHLITYSVSRHAHSSWELIYCTGGEGKLYYDSAALPYREGDVILVPPLLSHWNESETGFTNIHLNMTGLPLSAKEPILLHDGSNHFLFDAFSAAFFHFSSEPGKQTELLAAYANLIVCLIQNEQNAPVHNATVEEIKRHIIRSYPDENFELETYLRSLPFNYDYLRKLFKSETGVTPHRFLSDIRLQAAAERLGFSESEGVSIAEVGRLCGFHDPLYFSRAFRKKFGLSPLQYQKHLRLEHSPVPDGESIKLRL